MAQNSLFDRFRHEGLLRWRRLGRQLSGITATFSPLAMPPNASTSHILLPLRCGVRPVARKPTGFRAADVPSRRIGGTPADSTDNPRRFGSRSQKPSTFSFLRLGGSVAPRARTAPPWATLLLRPWGLLRWVARRLAEFSWRTANFFTRKEFKCLHSDPGTARNRLSGRGARSGVLPKPPIATPDTVVGRHHFSLVFRDPNAGCQRPVTRSQPGHFFEPKPSA